MTNSIVNAIKLFSIEPGKISIFTKGIEYNLKYLNQISIIHTFKALMNDMNNNKASFQSLRNGWNFINLVIESIQRSL